MRQSVAQRDRAGAASTAGARGPSAGGMASLAERVALAERIALGESTPLMMQAPKTYNLERLGIQSREVWSFIIVALLFVGKAVQPFVNDAVHVTQAALIEDPDLGISTTLLGGLVSAQDFTGGISKAVVAVSIQHVGPRNAWLAVLFSGTLNMLVISSTKFTGTIFVCTVLQSFAYAFLYPSTTMCIAGWVDGQALGRAIGVVAVATKMSPIIMSTLYAQLLKESWRLCFLFASGVFAVMFVIFLIFMRSSAESCGFRAPTPPGMRLDQKARAPPLANEPSSMRAMATVMSMRRTWALMLAFCLLVLLKSSAKFASIYAKTKLGLNPSDATSLFTIYAVASACSGLFGGFLYDIVPGGKFGIGVLMTSLNLLNLAGFIYGLFLERRGGVTLELLQVFMAIVGFAGVLPVSLPFQIYAMAIGGVAHCGMIVATFEGFAMCVEAALDLLIGTLLEEQAFATWLLVNVFLAALGTIFMALFYYLDWRKAPKAPVLTAVPSMNFLTRSNSKLQLWMDSFASGITPPLTPKHSPNASRRSPPRSPKSPSATPPAHNVSFDLSAAELDRLGAVGEEDAEDLLVRSMPSDPPSPRNPPARAPSCCSCSSAAIGQSLVEARQSQDLGAEPP